MSFCCSQVIFYMLSCKIRYQDNSCILLNFTFKSLIEDRKTLRHLLSYLYRTTNDKIIIEVNVLQILYTCIDTTYGVYNNMRIQTSGATSLR